MFDKPSNAPENDPLKGKFDGIDQELRAPAELKKAAKTGIPLYRSKRESTAVHLRRFAKATVAYAVGVLLFLGAVMMLPKLWESDPVNSPGTNMTTTDAVTDGTDSSVPPENSDSADVTDTPPIDQTPDTGEDYSNIIYGTYVEMGLLHSSMNEFVEFYTIFQRKNTAPIVVTDLGNQKNSITQYHFYGGIINKNTFPDDYDYDYSSGEIRVPIQFWYSFYYNCDNAYLGTYDYGIIAENYALDNDAVIDLKNIRLKRVSTELETVHAKHELEYNEKKDGEIRYYEIYSGEHRLMKFAICAVASTEDSYYDEICQLVVDGLVKLG